MRTLRQPFLLLLALAATGCDLILGLDKYTEGPGGGSSSSSSGSGGGAALCVPSVDTQECYSGPPTSRNVGACKTGTQTCNTDGTSFGMCLGEVVPTSELCATSFDDDCDGLVNEEGADCSCAPGTTIDCYSGAPGTEAHAPCHRGTQECKANGMGYEPCTGEVTPGLESCDIALVDEDCDGEINESGTDCVCGPGSQASCYTGPLGTEGEGICLPGMKICDNAGLAYGACSGDVLPATEDCYAPADEDCNGVSCSEPLWANMYPSSFPTSVATDSLGNVFVAGYFSNTVTFGGTSLISAGASDIYLAKFGPTGTPLWAKRFGNVSYNYEYSRIAVDGANNVIIVGGLDGAIDFGGGALTSAGGDDVFVAKFSGTGAFVWAKRFGDAGTQSARSVATDATGNVVVTGEFGSSVNFGGLTLTCAGSGQDIFLVKLKGSDGAHLWSKDFGTTSSNYAKDVAIDSSGNISLVGEFISSINFGGSNLNSVGTGDIYVAKFDSLGNHAWSYAYGDAATATYVAASAVDSLGNIIVTGAFQGALKFGATPTMTAVGTMTSDVFVAKITSGGTPVWSQRYGSTSSEFPRDVAVDSANNIAVVGDFLPPSIGFGGPTLSAAGFVDMFLAKFDPAGAHLWSHAYGLASSGQESKAIGIDQGTNEIAFASHSSGNGVQVGPFMLAGAGTYVARIAP